jgi:hypothetical protein
VELHHRVRITACGTYSEFPCQRFDQRIKNPDSQLECLERSDELSRPGLDEFRLYHTRLRSVGYYLDFDDCQRALRPNDVLLARKRIKLRRHQRLVCRMELQNAEELVARIRTHVAV